MLCKNWNEYIVEKHSTFSMLSHVRKQHENGFQFSIFHHL